MNNPKMLMVIAVVGLLILTVAVSGCQNPITPPAPDYRRDTTLTATWIGSRSTGGPGGFTVSGKLTETATNNPLKNKQVVLVDNNNPNNIIKQTTTNDGGEYKFTLSSSEEKTVQVQTYATGFLGSGSNPTPSPSPSPGPNDLKASGYNVAVGYYGIMTEISNGKTVVQGTPSLLFLPGTKTAILTVLSAVELQLKYGRYSDAADKLQTLLLPHFAGVATRTTGTSYWIKDPVTQQTYSSGAAGFINDCRIFAGQVTESSTSEHDTVFNPPLLPT